VTEPLRTARTASSGWPRAWVWLQLLLGWVPVWALYTALIVSEHQPITFGRAGALAVRSLLPAALLGVLVHRLLKRMPWPRPFRLRFALFHLIAAPAYAISWVLASSLVESVLRRHLILVVGPGLFPFLVLGVWLYVMVAGISYAIEGTERAARAEAASVRMQLAALRAQLHPHFLFNALHTVVQLIPTDPVRAADAAEQLAALLRTTLEDRGDLISLREEWAFMSRYLDLERIRFGDRLRVHAELDPELQHDRVPSFALQTLVENAVRHGASPRVAPTDITITATSSVTTLTLRVEDTGNGMQPRANGGEPGSGTGIARLRDRLAALYGDGSSLVLTSGAGGGFSATLLLPRTAEE
jgi:signal transduction histidine kinase